MSPTRTQFTPHPDVDALLSTLLEGAQTVLGNQFIGMYLHGSLAFGDFDPARSDIDFLVVTREELPPDTLKALAAMHARITTSTLTWAKNHEGSYIPRQAIRRYAPAHSLHPVIHVDGSFGLDRHASDWVVQRHIIREHGLALAGPAPHTLIDPVAPDDLRLAVIRLLREWWAQQVADPFRLQPADYQAYAILTMCRALYTIQFGTVVSKPVAARWAQGAVGEPWAGLIDSAMAWRHGRPMDRLSETVAFIQYTLERSQQPEARE